MANLFVLILRMPIPVLSFPALPLVRSNPARPTERYREYKTVI
jgi:hypothetical protein